MKDDINLALKKEPVKKKIGKSFIISLVLFVMVFLASGGEVLYNYYLNTKLKNLEMQEAQITNSVNNFSSKRSKMILLQERITSIKKIRAERSDISQNIQALFDLLTESEQTQGIDIAKGAGVSIQIKSPDLFEINQLFDRIQALSKQSSTIKKVVLTSFGFDRSSKMYLMSLSIDFSK